MIAISDIRRSHLQKLVDPYGSVTSFSAHLNRSKAQISQWLNASPDSKTGKPRNISDQSARLIESKCNKPVGWMDTPHDRLDLTGETGLASNISPLGREGFYPVISELDARDWEERYSDYAPNNSTSWIGCDKEIGPRSYGLVVTGDAMIAAFGISFTPGCKVIVDPGQRDNIKSGDKVVAKIEGVDGVLFRVFIEEAGKRFLKPLNAQYDNITDDFHILGKVIQKVEDV